MRSASGKVLLRGSGARIPGTDLKVPASGTCHLAVSGDGDSGGSCILRLAAS